MPIASSGRPGHELEGTRLTVVRLRRDEAAEAEAALAAARRLEPG